MSRSTRYALTGRIFICLLICFSLLIEAAQAKAAGPRITISQAKWAKGVLTVKGSVRHSAAAGVDVYDGSGRLLGQAPVDGKHRFALSRNDLDRPELLCSVQAKATDATATVVVKGKPKSCAKVPQCKILSPVGSVAATVNTDVTFKAKATLKDKKAKPLKTEWDFAGGSMGEAVPNTTPQIYHRPTGTDTTVQFVRDNGRYRVRFMAWDRQNQYCEDSVEVVVGTPPDADADFAKKALPNVQTLAQAAQQSAPAKGAPLQGQTGDWVVLPFQDWTMQNATDAKTLPNTIIPLGVPVTNINAMVYKKGRQPMVVDSNSAALFYSAASNPADPAGANSINSTSQNWPLDKPLQQATVQKSDWFENYTRPADLLDWLGPDYLSYSYAGFLDPNIPTLADEGFHNTTTVNTDHGRYMPGIAKPYEANAAQPFSDFDATGNHFAARLLPVTDIDDNGRVNPNPLFRIEARNAQGTVAATEVAVNATRDMRCRTCHLTGGIGSNPEFSKQNLIPFTYHEASGTSLFDQEYAALGNAANMHRSFRGGQDEVDRMDLGNGTLFSAERSALGLIANDGPRGCASMSGCHISSMQSTPFGFPIADHTGGGALSNQIHGKHAEYFYRDAGKTDIARTTMSGIGDGVPMGRDIWSDWDPQTGSLPGTLFPVKDADGKLLPMEDNCLLCHGGLREQSYRDRMYSAGITCYQCHGDILAVAGSLNLAMPTLDGDTNRRPWIDEPDCGSCHTGNANRGKDGSGGYFSAGVMKTAFDETDPSATPRQPDSGSPDEVRFAVPVTSMQLRTMPDPVDSHPMTMTSQSRLYRVGKDNHGQVPCAACHGGAHGIWPMADPNANDNLTSLQLQGHAGPIAECKVCHTADAFAQFADLDEGIRPVDPKVGILGGPHNMHPVNDPNWWQGAAADDTPNTRSGKVNGGWHNDYAKIPGRTGEDQCAACHGNDHRGTRLSKTPVDREFVTAKGKKLKVPAGTEIGCDLCHTVERSCTGSPAGDCGQPSDKVAVPLNQKPVITSPAETHVVLGEDYRHTVAAADPENQPLSYALGFSSASPTVDGATFSLPADQVLALAPRTVSGHRKDYLVDVSNDTPFLFDYYVTVSDPQGAATTQQIRVFGSCPPDRVYDRASQSCQPAIFTSLILDGVFALNVGETFRYPVTARQRNGQPVSLSLLDAPVGMTMDAAGVVTWTPTADEAGRQSFTVVATGQGGSVQQSAALTVCAPPLYWNPKFNTCVAAVQFDFATISAAVDNGTPFRARLTASQVSGLPLSFTLSGAPDGMAISPIDDHSARIDWVPQLGATGNFGFAVTASDGQGGSADLPVYVSVCVAPELAWLGSCQSPVQFTSQLSIAGLAAGEHFTFTAKASHLKGLPITYRLGSDAPPGMTIDHKTGQIDWTVVYNPDGYVGFTAIASDDGSPQASASQYLQINVCEAGMRWEDNYGCQGPVIIQPQTLFGADAGTTFSYPVKAGLPGGGSFTLSLADQPAGMTMDANGLITWKAAVDPVNGNGFGFTVIAVDAQGRQTLQYGGVTVCEAPTHWNNDSQTCE